MKKKYLTILLFLASATLYANTPNLFSVECGTDLATKFLANVFGGDLFRTICGGAGADGQSYLPEVFKVFNQGLLVFAGGFISYAAVTSTLKGASDGGAAGGKSNPWVPVRLATGATLLTPVASGYSLIQMIVMWAVVQGVGLADHMWAKQVEQLSDGLVNVGKPVQLDITPKLLDYAKLISGDGDAVSLTLAKGDMLTVPRIYAVGVCLAALDKANIAQNTYDNTTPRKIFGVFTDCSVKDGDPAPKNTICAGSPDDKLACGMFSFEAKDFSDIAMNNIKEYVSQSILLAKAKASDYMSMSNNGFNDKDCIGNICSTLMSITEGLKGKLIPYLAVKEDKLENKTDDKSWAKDASKMGWIAAGQYYYKFQNQSTNSKVSIDVSKLQVIMPKVLQPFAVVYHDKPSAKVSNDSFNGLFAAKDNNVLAGLVKQLKSDLGNDYVGNKIASESKAVDESMSSNNKSSPIYKGALKLKNELTRALKTVPLNIDIDNSVFRMSSYIFPTSLSAPLDNMLVLLGLVASEFSGLDIRKPNWVDENLSDMPSFKKTSSYGPCSEGKDFKEGCRKENKGLVGYLFTYFDLQPDSDNKTTKVIDPLTNVTNIGRAMLRYSMNYWVNTLQAIYNVSKDLVTNYSVTNAAIAAGSGLLQGLGPLGSIIGGAASAAEGIMNLYYSLDKYNLGVFLPLGVAISGVFFLLGVILGVYVPLIPFMVFAFTAIGWLVSVIEAMIAAPLVALGVTHPQGHDLLGKSEQATILLLGIFIRPGAIILGFIAAIVLLKQILLLINIGFLNLVIGLFDSSGINKITSANEIISRNMYILGIMLVYVYILLAAVNQVFGLIYQVPEKLMRWIGAAPEQSGVAQMVGEVKQGMQSSGQQLGQGGSQMASQKPEMSTVDNKSLSKSAKKMGESLSGKKDHSGES